MMIRIANQLNHHQSRLAIFMLSVTAVLSRPIAARAQSASSEPPAAPATPEQAAFNYFGDIEVTNQDGQRMRLFTDLMKGKIVIINAFFTSCTGVCPPMTRNL